MNQTEAVQLLDNTVRSFDNSLDISIDLLNAWKELKKDSPKLAKELDSSYGIGKNILLLNVYLNQEDKRYSYHLNKLKKKIQKSKKPKKTKK